MEVIGMLSNIVQIYSASPVITKSLHPEISKTECLIIPNVGKHVGKQKNAKSVVLNSSCTLESPRELENCLGSHPQRFWFNWSGVGLRHWSF